MTAASKWGRIYPVDVAVLVLNSAVLLLVLLRISSLVISMVISYSRSAELRRRVDLLPLSERYDREVLAEVINDVWGKAFIFGSRSYMMRANRRDWANAKRSLLYRLARLGWQLAVFVVLANGYVIVIAALGLSVGGPQLVLGVAICGFLLVAMFLSAVTVFVGASTLPPDLAILIVGGAVRPGRTPLAVQRMLMFGVQIVLVWLTSATSFFFVSQAVPSFGAMSGPTTNLSEFAGRYFEGVYHSFVTIIGLAEPDPQSGAARTIVAMAAGVGVAYLVVSIALVLSSDPVRETQSDGVVDAPTTAEPIKTDERVVSRPSTEAVVGRAMLGLGVLGAIVTICRVLKRRTRP